MAEIELYCLVAETGRTPPQGKTWLKDRQRLRRLLPEVLTFGSRGQLREALLALRDHLDIPAATPKVLEALSGMESHRRDDEADLRILACEVLGKCGDLRAVPMLIGALADPYMRYDKSGGPDGKGRHVAVWWGADAALRRLTGAKACAAPVRDVHEQLFESTGKQTSSEDARAAWTEWWNRRPGAERLSRAEAVELAAKTRKDDAGRPSQVKYWPEATIETIVSEGGQQKVRRERAREVWAVAWHSDADGGRPVRWIVMAATKGQLIEREAVRVGPAG